MLAGKNLKTTTTKRVKRGLDDMSSQNTSQLGAGRKASNKIVQPRKNSSPAGKNGCDTVTHGITSQNRWLKIRWKNFRMHVKCKSPTSCNRDFPEKLEFVKLSEFVIQVLVSLTIWLFIWSWILVLSSLFLKWSKPIFMWGREKSLLTQKPFSSEGILLLKKNA